jgi:hypothetical protein
MEKYSCGDDGVAGEVLKVGDYVGRVILCGTEKREMLVHSLADVRSPTVS